MVCRRCVMTVETICRDLNWPDAAVSMGEVTLSHPANASELQAFKEKLEDVGFELLVNRDIQLVEQCKSAIRAMARGEGNYKYKLSSFVEERVGVDFNTLSRLFSEQESRSLQAYLMQQRIEYVKELLQDAQLTLGEIADCVGFSSVAHLSRAFKNVQGVTISDYRTSQSRLPLDEV